MLTALKVTLNTSFQFTKLLNYNQFSELSVIQIQKHSQVQNTVTIDLMHASKLSQVCLIPYLFVSLPFCLSVCLPLCLYACSPEAIFLVVCNPSMNELGVTWTGLCIYLYGSRSLTAHSYKGRTRLKIQPLFAEEMGMEKAEKEKNSLRQYF